MQKLTGSKSVITSSVQALLFEKTKEKPEYEYFCSKSLFCGFFPVTITEIDMWLVSTNMFV